ncbi:MAG TPA: OmpH family outer membrane protein [Blastocatellia bacterium]|nr:OmpH family outer membrane protein [Blastocatellia bacterium]
MKKLFPSAIALCVLMTLATFAQTPTPPSRPAGGASAPAAVTGGTGAEGKVAFVDTAAFRTGIQELKVKLDTLNTEFEPRNKEIQAKQEEITNLNNKIQTQGSTVTPAVRNQWADELNQKQVAYKRFEEDLNTLAKKRYEEVSGPVYEKIGTALEQYAKQHGITVIFEVNALSQGQALIYRLPASDITDDFMKEYNRTNPAGAAGSAARRP